MLQLSKCTMLNVQCSLKLENQLINIFRNASINWLGTVINIYY
jgi:hypothetical protein